MFRSLAALFVLLVTLLLAGGCGITASSGTGFRQIGSDLVHSVRYDAGTEMLTVITTSAEGIDFRAVPQDVYEKFMAAASKDRFFEEQIKGKYKADKF